MRVHFLLYHKAVKKEAWQQVVPLGACRFAEFALLEEPSSESLGQGRPSGPTQVEIVVQVNLTALLNWLLQSASCQTCITERCTCTKLSHKQRACKGCSVRCAAVNCVHNVVTWTQMTPLESKTHSKS